jgi:hypothetical protein
MTFVELPAETQLAVIGLIAALVDLGINALIAYAPWLGWLEPYKEEWGHMAGVAVLAFLQNLLPGDYAEASILAVQLVLAIIAIVMGAKKFLAKRGAPKLLPRAVEQTHQ